MHTYLLLFFVLISTNFFVFSEEKSSMHTINFKEIPATELIRFVSRVAEKNFIFDHRDFQFPLTFISGRPSSSSELMKALEHLLEQKGFIFVEQAGHILIKKNSIVQDFTLEDTQLSKEAFHIYKLQYQKGSELLEIVKQVALAKKKQDFSDFHEAISSMQWIQSTNSLVYTGSHSSKKEIESLLKSLDIAQKQVFIEVLVIETDAKEASEFGLEWGGLGHYKEKLNLGFGNFGASSSSSLAQGLKNVSHPLSASNSLISFGKGFDLGVIGDLLFHKGRSFLSLGSLISALEKNGNISVVLNQKILTQDNKSSSIFVGDNIPFTGSVVQTVGAAQQTTANIEYRDIGVSLDITPLLGEEDIITLDIKEEITEAREDLRELEARSNGIQTTKTNMSTRVHVPDKHFLVLSGMVKNSKIYRRTGIPCLGGIPWIGALFSKNKIDHEKRNILVFVRPQIIHSFDHYSSLSSAQEQKLKQEMNSKASINIEELK
jgi:type III secretion protein C